MAIIQIVGPVPQARPSLDVARPRNALLIKWKKNIIKSVMIIYVIQGAVALRTAGPWRARAWPHLRYYTVCRGVPPLIVMASFILWAGHQGPASWPADFIIVMLLIDRLIYFRTFVMASNRADSACRNVAHVPLILQTVFYSTIWCRPMFSWFYVFCPGVLLFRGLSSSVPESSEAT